MTTNHLRTVRFSPYRKGCGPTFTLETWDTGNHDSYGKWIVGYRLRSQGKTIFEGEDFCCSPMHAIDSDEAIASLMAFLTLRPGDTDREYFANYTPAQLEFCDQHAEMLACEVQSRFGQD